MLHLRVLCPAEQSEQVRQLLLDSPGVAHLTVLPGVAVRPPGDVLEATLTRECADDVLDALTNLGVDRSGGITLEAIDTVLSDSADAAEAAVPGDPADAVIWDELIARTGEDSRLTVSFLAFLTIACLLAAIGVITNSPVTVVGAMVLGPEFGPLAAVAVGLVLRRVDLIRRGGIALLVGFPVAMAITVLVWLVFRLTGLLAGLSLENLSQVDFIYEVGPFSLIIALLAGAAGMLSLTSAKSSALVGVFISVTTVPAAAFAIVAVVDASWDRALSSVVQLLVNLVGIVLAAVLVLWLSPSARKHRMVGRQLSGE
ncbi:MAG TPA: DUF389 domain-containing protein [Pseudonocardia sp.]|uniref:DUF389 domain-containing protein n=1 Tax=Pseudonocardia sp. TaxID=60912 RepID=UPI002B9C733A|nr:DUF389 domain-containing protein [Pseudonocardia sp.]HTF52080.1 DUF389 domain-containing protein [Pseudonocardia sp.]